MPGAPCSTLLHRVDHGVTHCPSLEESQNSYRPSLVQCIGPEARPSMIFRLLRQAARNRIPMHVPQLLDLLAFREDIEIVVARKPERRLRRQPGNLPLQRRDRLGERFYRRFRHQKMHMSGHDDVAVDAESVLTLPRFQNRFEDSFGVR